MARELEGKRALVTGSSSGLGEAIAKRLSREGARLIVHGRNVERAERVAQEIRAAGGEAHVAIGDLMQADQADAVCDTAERALGGIDILVNNAGGESAGRGQASFFDAKPEEWLSTYNGNVVCAIRMIQRFAPGMKAAGWGRIIQISSLVSHRPNLVIPDYAAAKAALNNMTVGLSLALAGSGVTANSISPGVILTPGVEGWFRSLAGQFGWGTETDEIEKRAVAELAPNHIGRAGRPADVAHAVMYLASPQGGFVTGTDMKVSGGP
ncbi:MAG TPA: SDR family NAD(P)-dependent oxidoreductase [Alphaproteobacteria bacterium]|jgi:NAD(P)-dependent dehydrogenase (short-subunit alcohol dehydrogenase family)|nr:SDR family NAD(P)-dependent oxidoreductase [Alphaproteobacteria bacterium]